MIDPKKIDPLQLPFLPLSDRGKLPNKHPVVYWVIDADDTLLRVGSLLHPRAGFKVHFYRCGLQRFPDARIAWLALPRKTSASQLRSLRNSVVRKSNSKQVQSADYTRFTLSIGRPLLEQFHSVLERQGLSRAGTIAQLIESWLQQNQEAAKM